MLEIEFLYNESELYLFLEFIYHYFKPYDSEDSPSKYIKRNLLRKLNQRQILQSHMYIAIG